MTIIILLLILYALLLLIKGEMDMRKYKREEALKMKKAARRYDKEWP